MSTFFGAGSRSSSYSAKSITPSSPSAAPTDPLPTGQTKPSDILINRLHEIKRITKSLAAYLDGISSAYSSHSATLLKLSAPGVISTPLQESSLFIPPPLPKGVSQGGWSDLLNQIKEGNKQTADEQAAFAKIVSKDVVVPMKGLRTQIKNHISIMEKEIARLSEVVVKERDSSATTLAALAQGIQSLNMPQPGVAHTPANDPVLLRSAADAQMTSQIGKENELLKAVLSWQDKTEQFEKEIFGKVNALWKTYEAAHSNMLLENQQRSVFLSANVDSTEPQAEWGHFATLNHLIPAETQPKTLESVLYPHKDDPLTIPLKQGLLDRQKKFIRTWQTGAYWVLTPSGNLHSYPDSSAPLSKPNLSIPLSACSLGPLPSPEADAKGKTAEPCFTLETPDGKQVLRAKSWEELDSWHHQLDKFTQKTELPPLPPHEEDDHNGDLGVRTPTEEEDLHAEAPPPVPPRAPPALPPRTASDIAEPVVDSPADATPDAPSSPAAPTTNPVTPVVPVAESFASPSILTEEPEGPEEADADFASANGDISAATTPEPAEPKDEHSKEGDEEASGDIGAHRD